MVAKLDGINKSSNIGYKFMGDLQCNYENLILSYKSSAHELKDVLKTSYWTRDDYAELEHLSLAYKMLKKGEWPNVKWNKPMSLSQTRWNFRAIKSLKAWILDYYYYFMILIKVHDIIFT
ncbi:hypothetical protein A3Q56_04958 [Intoshia linei]|uniref:Uncharacterized protein n=1 Tax=Intoshia linei TaxID=1819745 RepID=A0A177B1F9_9BILA|nr:hypothetical protein A3Q56_04958 [Intoshia linei]